MLCVGRIWTTHTDHTDNGLSECRLEADAKERALRICGTLVVLTESQVRVLHAVFCKVHVARCNVVFCKLHAACCMLRFVRS